MDTSWWKDAVVYQIYPRSFQDSNGDGIGDISGIIQRLDYIKSLGANVIWLCPIYSSPNMDNGYDISDYYSINPDFGTMEDFDLFLKQAHQRELKVIMDLVVNHTSDEHPWFIQSRENREGEFADFYIWESQKPNEWGSWFGGSAWEYDYNREQYYLHIFSKKQPDLNWRNPEVRNKVYEMMAWWLNKGVDGFRMDVISLISKPDGFGDSNYYDLSPSCINGPHVHDYLREMNEKVLSRYNIMTVGECPSVTVDEALKYSGFKQNELNMVFQFDHTSLTDGKWGKWTDEKTDLVKLKAVFSKWQKGLYGKAWNCLFWGNHDQPRAVSKFGSDLPEYRTVSAKMLCLCLYLMQGTPFIFQGEELGMPNPKYSSLEQYRDIETINAYHNFVDSGTLDKRTMLDYLACVSRDNARSPMQWNGKYSSGFSSGTPWIDMGSSWRAVNVERELYDEDSVLNFYKKVIKFRNNNVLIREGSFELLLPESTEVFAYSREYANRKLIVICNFTNNKVKLDKTLHFTDEQVILSNYKTFNGEELRPYEALAICD